jgi:hypothetical protein
MTGARYSSAVEDRTRHIRRVAKPLELEERLADLSSNHIVARLLPEIDILPWRRGHVVAVQGPSKPLWAELPQARGGRYVRVARRTAGPTGSSSTNRGGSAAV